MHADGYRASLPLMGIVNLGVEVLLSGRLDGSLPLMGIVNPHRMRGSDAMPAILITPHGDREPPWAEMLPLRARSSSLPLMGIVNSVLRPGIALSRPSLPLMGIVNAMKFCGLTPAAWHSLPLMGIVNLTGLVVQVYADNSLPLMGIVNDDDALLARAGLGLITPHGDRELESARRRRVSRGAHYPSWGS